LLGTLQKRKREGVVGETVGFPTKPLVPRKKLNPSANKHKQIISTIYIPLKMKFCEVCNNMYYIGIDEKDGNMLTYYCRNCGHKDATLATENTCVLNTQLKRGEQKFNHIINQYTKLDPTIPRIYNMKCPNAMCKTNHDGSGSGSGSDKTEVLYIRYDDDNMKYLYMCTTCDTTWKTDDSH